MRRSMFLASATSLLATSRRANASGPAGLSIHHIAHGRGNATLLICPDGTTILVDAGNARAEARFMPALQPPDAVSAGDALARYIGRRLRAVGRSEIDVALLTHFHGDHLGEFRDDEPPSSRGPYRRTGISDLAERIPIRRIVDRDFPKYDYPVPLQDPTGSNYRRFVETRLGRRERVERFVVGSSTQLGLERRGQTVAPFSIRNLAANGVVWTGQGQVARATFPELATLASDNYPSENMCCCAIRVTSGPFAYYIGGDLTFATNDGADPWRDIESPVARACGPVDVAAVNHHGYHDAVGAPFLRALQPRALIVQAWHVTHPAISTMERMVSRKLYAGERDIFLTDSTPENQAINERFTKAFASTDGHVVVDVAPDGSSYHIAVVDNRDDRDAIQARFGPYASRSRSASTPLTRVPTTLE